SADRRHLPSFPTRRSSDLEAARRRLVEMRAALGYYDVDEGRRRDAIDHWMRRIDAAGREGIDYAVRRLLLGTLRTPTPSARGARSEEHTPELQSRGPLVCR